MILVIIIFIQLSVLIVSYRNLHKVEGVYDEAQSLLDLIEEKQQEEIKCNTQMVNKLRQDAYNNGYNDGFVKGRSLNRKRRKK